MNDDSAERLDSFFAAARAAKPDTSLIEYGFESRLMAKIREKRERNFLWHAWVWRLVPFFAGIALVIGLLGLFIPPAPSQDLFSTVTNGHEENLMVSFLTGE